MLKRTPLYGAHQKLGGKLIEFGGWEMPVQYTSITDEHLAVRNAVGVFDISHMGEITVDGSAAGEFLNSILTNDIRKLAPGEGQYTLLCNERAGVVDDLYVFRLSEEVYLLIVNASRTAEDVSWLRHCLEQFPGRAEVRMTDASHNYAAIAVQGPRVCEFVDDCLPGSSLCSMRVPRVTELKKNQIGGFSFQGANVLVSRTGYTGEDGFEMVGRDESIVKLWESVLQKGQPFGIKPCGLGARDTLRTEMCYPLYGHELDEIITPLEAGLGFFVSLDKGKFVGSESLAQQKAAGVQRKCVAFRMADRSAPPRPHYPIWAGGTKVGEVTSGTQSPSLGAGLGMGYVPAQLARPDTAIEIEIRGRRSPAVVVSKPIYRKKN